MASTRRLAAILAADVAGYSRLMGTNEEGTHERLKAHLRELVEPKIAEHRGRIVKNTGDGLLAEFASVVDAVRCATEVQRAMVDREPEVTDEQRIRFRIGVNLGDVIVEEHDIFGDGVNVAARLEALADAGGICVSRVVRDQVRDRLDYTFEDLGEQQVKNIARPVRVYRVRDVRAAGRTPASAPPALALPDEPSIAVLPFANLSGDPEQEYFADGMVEEIITALSRIHWLFVIARNSSFTYKGKSVDVKQVGRELGVRYVLEGSVRKAGGRVRITGQLIDANTGAHLWADRFDASLEDVFELQDKVAISVAGVIEPTLQAAETARSAHRPTNDLGAYDLYLRALPSLARISKDGLSEAANLLEQAIARDPNYGPALAFAAICHQRLATDGWTTDPEARRQKAMAFARRAIEVAGDDPVTVINAAYPLAYFGEDIGDMIALADRALSLNPSYARGWYVSAILRVIAGEPEVAIERIDRSVRLSPRDYPRAPQTITGLAHFLVRHFELAAQDLRLSVRHTPGCPAPYRLLAACYAHLGRHDDARATIEQLRAMGTDAMPHLPFPNREIHELLVSGLRLAMGEET